MSIFLICRCANDWLLQTTLRDSWRFDGYVTSDCGAINNECQAEPQGHGYNNCTAAAAQSIKAGTDVDCGEWIEFVCTQNSYVLSAEDVH